MVIKAKGVAGAVGKRWCGLNVISPRKANFDLGLSFALLLGYSHVLLCGLF